MPESIPPDFEPVDCPLCGSRESAPRFRARAHLFRQPGDFSFVSCQECSLTYLNPRPTLAALQRYYPAEYFCYRPVFDSRRTGQPRMAGLAGQLSLRRIRQLERYVGRVPSSARILDVGCGANSFLYHLHRLRGCETLGIDFNAEVVAAIRDRLAMPAMCGALRECRLEAEAFDGVAMYEYLEHEGEPRKVLAEARRVTKPGGWLAIEIPNVGSRLAAIFGRKWCQLDAPRHLVLYDTATIRRLLVQGGYEVIAVRPLCYQWMFGFSVLVAAGFRKLGRLPLLETALAVAITLPFLPLPWIWPEFLRVYARKT
jgi:SAM-dependent methyltransferase